MQEQIQTQGAPLTSASLRAAIDIGSNTIHMVVARCLPNDLEIVEDQTEMVRIGESVTATGAISPQKCVAALATIREYQALAKHSGADQIFVVATEAIRQASNSADFRNLIQQETGLEMHLISGPAEAEFTFYGATYETLREPNAPAQLGVMDLGGGSMELVTAKHAHITWRTSFPIGSGWLHDRYLPSDPPTYDELSIASTFLRTYLQGMRVKYRPPVLIVTGGSANSLLYLAHLAFGLDLEKSRMTLADLIHCEGILSALPAEEISQRYRQPLSRTHILPSGALIIRSVMERLHLQEIRINPHGIREGVLLASARYGERWREHVEEIANTSSKSKGKAAKQIRCGKEAEDQGETFMQSAQRILPERLKKMLALRNDVFKHEDIEAVHRMRVASRRIRAALDAYEPCCQPKQFQKTYRQVKKLADRLGEARDTDVMLQDLHGQIGQATTDEAAALQWLIDRLDTYRQDRQRVLETALQALDENSWEQQLRSCLTQEEGGAPNGKG